MAGNSTSPSGLTTVTAGEDGEHAAQTVGLIVGLILTVLVILVPVVVYIIRRTRHISRSEQLPKTEGTSPQEPDTHYTTTPALGHPSTVQSPIYENVHGGFHDAAPKRQHDPVAFGMPSGHDDDPYMNCDPVNEAVYSNDPSFQHECNIEDDYVVPDTL